MEKYQKSLDLAKKFLEEHSVEEILQIGEEFEIGEVEGPSVGEYFAAISPVSSVAQKVLEYKARINNSSKIRRYKRSCTISGKDLVIRKTVNVAPSSAGQNASHAASGEGAGDFLFAA